MRHQTKRIVALAVACLALSAGACNKGPADTALQAAEQALANAKPELERYAPQDLAALQSAIGDARAQFDQGRYTDALKAARLLPDRVQAALAAAALQQERLTAEWNALAVSLPQRVETISARLSALDAGQALPRGLTKEALAGAQADLATLARAFTDATTAFRAGDVAQAVKAAQDVTAKVDLLAGTLGLKTAAAGAAAH
jgi:hypothetical protein